MVVTLMIGVSYQFSRNIYFRAKTNALVNNFISPDHQLHFDDWLSGQRTNRPFGIQPYL